MRYQFADAVQDDAVLRSCLEEADIVPAMLVMVQLTGDMGILDRVAPYIHGPWSFSQTIPEPLKHEIREKLCVALQDYARSSRQPPTTIPTTTLTRMMSAAVGEVVSPDYVPLLKEIMQLDGQDLRTVKWRQAPGARKVEEFNVVIIGAGLSGICAGIQLKSAGIPFVILEKNPDLGGTWFENVYPGCGVDTPNHFYSYSFNPNDNWSRHFSKRDEIWQYIEDTVSQYDLRRDIRFNVEVLGAEFQESSNLWNVRFRDSDGEQLQTSGKVLISAVGQLNRPSLPDIRGLSDFAGPCFHTAQWDAQADLQSKRVGMIGTGASGMQAGPSVAPLAEKLTVFQRTPHWTMRNPNYNKTVTEGHKWALKHIPFFSAWNRFQMFWASAESFHDSLRIDPDWPQADVSLNSRNHQVREDLIAYIRSELSGHDDLISKCIPDFPPYGKRMLRDNDWYPMLKRENVELVTDRISHVTKDAVVMQDGSEHALDVLILATGFQASKLMSPMDIRGRGGISIRDVWGDDDPRAYMGMTVPGFPNFFMTYGPNTNPGPGGSVIFYIECQVRYIMQAIREMMENGYASIEVRKQVHDQYNDVVDRLCRNMVWSHPRVNSWYKNKDNRVTVNSPWRQLEYWQLTYQFEPAEFICVEESFKDAEVMQQNSKAPAA